MKKTPLADLVMRTAIVRQPDVGYILAFDPARDENEDPHAIGFKWNAGAFTKGDRNYNAHTLCVTNRPELAVLDASEQGYYSITTMKGMVSSDIFDDSQPPPKKPRSGGIRSLAAIDGKGYAVGYGGMVYRLDALKKWIRIDDGLPPKFDIEAIHGFDASNLYVVGDKGGLWHHDGRKWTKCDIPTNANLNTIKCAGDGKVYLAGDRGVLLRGKSDQWEVFEHDETEEDIWDLEWFDGKLYVSTMENLYFLKKNKLVAVDFGKDVPESFYQLSAADGVMWSNGEHDIMSFDGKKWTRVV